MAEGFTFQCDKCELEIVAWTDGNPYFRRPNGKKQYAYHPNIDFEKIEGNDVPHLCLECGKLFNVDSNKPSDKCPKCRSTKIVETVELKKKKCPNCHEGTFRLLPEMRIS